MENIIIPISIKTPMESYEYYCSITDKLDEYILNKDIGYTHYLYKTSCMERNHNIAIYLRIGSVIHKLMGFIILDNNNIIKSIELQDCYNYYKDKSSSISKEMTDLFKDNKIQFDN
jgi:hypothetical protein